MTLEPTKKGREIEKHLDKMNMDPWFYIYEKFIKKESKKELNKTKKRDSSDQIS